MTGKPIPTLALVDDHTLFRKGMINLISMVNANYNILFEADNGEDLQKKISKDNQPDILLMDINMPHMDGFATVEWLREHYPLVNVLVVSMIQKEEAIVKMLKLGVKGYVCKDIEPRELGEALHSIANKGFYYTDFITGKLVHSLQLGESANGASSMLPVMNDREKDFLKLACTEFTYNEIAAKMFVSPKTVDGYRNSLFEKLNVKSRVGLALYAVKHGFVQL
ncbi:MAG: response regulator transcription factor [Chitinophagaceae bacterium]|nr:response regulator transcription factor [Chitinophagaceae bacterium]MCW5925858.1 response regulator transcription factor [Chitinophagaceae bacterium]